LGLPSLYSGQWAPLWHACEETDTVVAIHIGSSSHMPSTSPDAPPAVSAALTSQNAQGSVCDWVFSGTLSRHPGLRLLYAEAQVGWMPYLFERMDTVWKESQGWSGAELDEPPSSIVRGRVFGCLFDDHTGLANRGAIGMEHILFETDYPHSDGTWPRPPAVSTALKRREWEEAARAGRRPTPTRRRRCDASDTYVRARAGSGWFPTPGPPGSPHCSAAHPRQSLYPARAC
jgi:hypothetical protein